MKKLLIPAIIVISLVISVFVIVMMKDEDKKSNIIITNEEIIYERNLNESNNNSKSEKEIIDDLFEDKVLNNECEIRGIEVDENTLMKIKEQTQKKLTEEEMKKISDRNLTEQEFRDNLLIKLENMEKRVLLKEELMKEITDNDIKINNEKFKNKVDDFNKNRDSKSVEFNALKMQKLLDEYIDLLKKQYSQTID